MGKSQLESNYLNKQVYRSKGKKRKKTIVKVMINTRNIKRTNMMMLKKGLQKKNVGKESKKIQTHFFLDVFESSCLSGQSKNIQEGVKIPGKQGDHKSKPTITITKTKKKRAQEYNKRKSSNQKMKGTKEKHRINWKTRFKMSIHIYQ